jgi:hypothetical protein
MAIGKYEQLFLSSDHYLYEEPDKESMNRLEDYLKACGINIVPFSALA